MISLQRMYVSIQTSTKFKHHILLKTMRAGQYITISTRSLHTNNCKYIASESVSINGNTKYASYSPRKTIPMTTIERRKQQQKKREEIKKITINENTDRKLQQAYVNGRPLLTVIGLGGAGSNAVNNMIASQLEGVEFIVANTDCQALNRSMASRKLVLGRDMTKGLGAGSKPLLGKMAAEAQREEIEKLLAHSNMLFLTGGMGGGTCTGAAPVIASIARDMGILTVGVVSTPFRSEGPNRTRVANAGVIELAKVVDTLIVVPNANLLTLSTKHTTMLDAFKYADDVLLQGVKGVTDLIVRPGLINLDFADIQTILSKAGRAMMGSGVSSDKNGGRAREASELALVNPLLGDLPTESAVGLLVTIRGGDDLTLFEVDEIMEIIRQRVSDDANIIFGTCYDQSVEGSIHVSIIVSGIQTDVISPPVPSARSVFTTTDSSENKNGDSDIDVQTPETKKGIFSRFFSF